MKIVRVAAHLKLFEPLLSCILMHTSGALVVCGIDAFIGGDSIKGDVPRLLYQ